MIKTAMIKRRWKIVLGIVEVDREHFLPRLMLELGVTQ